MQRERISTPYPVKLEQNSLPRMLWNLKDEMLRTHFCDLYTARAYLYDIVLVVFTNIHFCVVSFTFECMLVRDIFIKCKCITERLLTKDKDIPILWSWFGILFTSIILFPTFVSVLSSSQKAGNRVELHVHCLCVVPSL